MASPISISPIDQIRTFRKIYIFFRKVYIVVLSFIDCLFRGRKLKRLGAILHIMDNFLVVRADSTLEHGIYHEGLLVVNRKMKKIGRIKEIFGPVKAPYISIRMFKDITSSEIDGLKNERVYLQ